MEEDYNVPKIEMEQPWEKEHANPCDTRYSDARTVTSQQIAGTATTFSLSAPNVTLKEGDLLFLEIIEGDNGGLSRVSTLDLNGAPVTLGQDPTTSSVSVTPFIYGGRGGIGFRVPADSKGINMTGTALGGGTAALSTVLLTCVQKNAVARYWESMGG